jgi:hypothetical protein
LNPRDERVVMGNEKTTQSALGTDDGDMQALQLEADLACMVDQAQGFQRALGAPTRQAGADEQHRDEHERNPAGNDQRFGGPVGQCSSR